MSAPHTDIDKQAKQHRGPLRGMFAVVLFALVLLLIMVFFVFGRGGAPEGADLQVEGSTGEVQATEGGSDPVSANDSPAEEEGAAMEGADPSAVTVPAETVETPQTGTDATINPDTGASENAEPATADQ